MASVAERRRRRALQRMGRGPEPHQVVDQLERPAWLDDVRELARRLEPFAALEAIGAIDRRQREVADRFTAIRRMAVEHECRVTASYGSRVGGGAVSEVQQAAARRWYRSALRRAGPARRNLEALAMGERPRLTERDVRELQAALDAIAAGSSLDQSCTACVNRRVISKA